MNLSRKWLTDYVNVTEVENKAYCDRMTDTGSKVEGFEVLASDIDNVVVGKITKITKHENSDHLQICMLDVGEENDIQIVTGAKNVFEGAVVPVAKAPAKLPGGVTIKAGKLRGVESNGMLCSIAELNLTTHDMPSAIEDGIFILNELEESKSFTLGMDIKEALMLSDDVVEFEITPNRPDCLSVIGLARESAASFEKELKISDPVVKELNDGDKIENYIKVDIESKLCPRYSARVVKNIKIEPSPLWLRMRLRASGVRPINNIVDITNYVMLEYGQPMHAFDYKCLDGSHIIVRESLEGEQFKSLDDIDHTLKAGMLVISDEKKAVALAGVMGGANSEITDETKTVVFESANFNGTSVRVTSRALGMRTESSSRFEKGIDSEATIPAIQRACELVQLLNAGDVVDGIIDVYPEPKATRTIKLDSEKINKFLGTNIDKSEMVRILRMLTFKVENDTIYVPSYRDDVEGMQDIAEEIARIYGYNEIETTNVVASLTQGERTMRQAYDVKIKDILCGMGLYEINTFSFISPKYYDKIRMPENDKRRKSVVISNPLGEDTSVMRTTSIPSMLEVLNKNSNLKNEEAALFEVSTIYIPNEDITKLPSEPKQVVIGMYGNTDFYDMKGVIDALLTACGIKDYKVSAKTDDNTYHPGRCAQITLDNGVILGTFGEIHPLVASNYSFNKRVYVAELDFEAMLENHVSESSYKPLPKFPALTRDFSFVCDEALEVGTIQDVMKKANVSLLESIKLFDVYRGVQIGEGKKSVSFSVSLRASDRTLNDTEADNAVKKLLKALERELGITLRQ
ncbi:MAG: phenylalanine--tRNA ligase subunit beta [Clostridia bacterium]|nr:phenylalanine--tRNA ligase subunit beta [Clostridia bacterium]